MSRLNEESVDSLAICKIIYMYSKVFVVIFISGQKGYTEGQRCLQTLHNKIHNRVIMSR